MLPEKLSFGDLCFSEIEDFLKRNYHVGYTLSIYDGLKCSTIEVMCGFDNMVDVIKYVVNIEHDFPAWIGVNELTLSYVVGLNFTRGNLHTPSVCEWRDGKLVERVRM